MLVCDRLFVRYTCSVCQLISRARVYKYKRRRFGRGNDRQNKVFPNGQIVKWIFTSAYPTILADRFLTISWPNMGNAECIVLVYIYFSPILSLRPCPLTEWEWNDCISKISQTRQSVSQSSARQNRNRATLMLCIYYRIPQLSEIHSRNWLVQRKCMGTRARDKDRTIADEMEHTSRASECVWVRGSGKITQI